MVLTTEKRIRVLIVEDSLTAQHLLRGIIGSDPLFEVVALAGNGKQAIDLATRLKPDIISMDINMPVMDGLEATRQIMLSAPVPIVIVSSQYEGSDVALSMKILEAGALTILPRPAGPADTNYQQSARAYRNILRLMAGVSVKARARPALAQPYKPMADLYPEPKVRSRPEILVIGASAGGPAALRDIVSGIRAGFPLPVLLVQHIDLHFVSGFIDWLNQQTPLTVKIAVNGEKLIPGTIYLSPGDRHLGVSDKGIAWVSTAPAERNLRPAVSFLFRNVAKVYGPSAIALLLSGMGADGAIEMLLLRKSGALTIAQNRETALVFGMPGEAVKLEAAALVLPPDQIVAILNKITS